MIPDPPAAPAAWWRLELAIPPELEESLLWKLESLGIQRLAVHHRPQAPGERELVGWLPALDWPSERREALAADLAALGEPFGCSLPPLRSPVAAKKKSQNRLLPQHPLWLKRPNPNR